MSTSAQRAGTGLLSIGEVMARLSPDFPDLTISKLRFLEAEKLVVPARAPSGYRKYALADVDRLRYVLTMQRDHYLPLKVIREHLDAIDGGLEPTDLGVPGPRAPRVLVSADGVPSPEAARPEVEPGCPAASCCGVGPRRVHAGRAGEPWAHPAGRRRRRARRGPHGRVDDGVRPQARHLRPFRLAADREVGLVAQVVTPMARGRSPQAKAQAEEAARELASHALALHAALVRRGLAELHR
jgi:DNA-binding transcriptional MerR regulator